MAEASVNSGDQTVTVTEDDNTQVQETQRLVLKLKKPEDKRKVKWEEGTVDNELMNKKKSKCCCIYEKPRVFGESSSEDDSDDECSSHCRGHKKNSHKDQPEGGASGSGAGADGSMAAS